MREVSGDLDLAEKPLGTDGGGEFGAQHFDRHLAMVFQILGEVDRGHPTSTDLPLDGIAVGEGGGEAVEKVRHCVLALLGTVLEYGLGRQAARRRGYFLTLSC